MQKPIISETSTKSCLNDNSKHAAKESFVHICTYMTKNSVNISLNDLKSSALCGLVFPNSFYKAFPEQKPKINPRHIKSIVGVGGTHHPVLVVIQN